MTEVVAFTGYGTAYQEGQQWAKALATMGSVSGASGARVCRRGSLLPPPFL